MGSEEEFVTRWTALVSSAGESPGGESFLLIQDRQDPHRFISFGAWDDWASADPLQVLLLREPRDPELELILEFGQGMGAVSQGPMAKNPVRLPA